MQFVLIMAEGARQSAPIQAFSFSVQGSKLVCGRMGPLKRRNDAKQEFMVRSLPSNGPRSAAEGPPTARERSYLVITGDNCLTRWGDKETAGGWVHPRATVRSPPAGAGASAFARSFRLRQGYGGQAGGQVGGQAVCGPRGAGRGARGGTPFPRHSTLDTQLRGLDAVVLHSYTLVLAHFGPEHKCSIGCIGCIGCIGYFFRPRRHKASASPFLPGCEQDMIRIDLLDAHL